MSARRGPAPWAGPLPPATPPASMAVHQLPTGTYRTRAAFAIAGGSLREHRDLAATAVLVTHPQGDLLIDAGFGEGVERHVQLLARFERAPLERVATVREQLTAASYDDSRLLGVLVTHVHWDHVSGLDSLDVPIWINRDEIKYGNQDRHGAVYREASVGRPLEEYAFDGPAYLGFPASHDVYGDGSVVIARAGGHTPGSVVVFVALPSGQRYAFIGDLTWQLDGIERRAQRPWFMRPLVDVDPSTVRQGLDRIIAVSDLVQIVPAHDRAAFAPLPMLSTEVQP